MRIQPNNLSNANPTPQSTLLAELMALELALHEPAVRANRLQLERLLHPQFAEVGRSGRAYTHSGICERLVGAGEQAQPQVEASHFAVSELGSGVALLTYRSAHRESTGTLAHHALRTSVWLRTETGWQMRYHQGTAALELW